ncbi:hypothetical protein SLS62_010672 [Diatrype stigma]|uniref:Uncharacterized protein n=1 Tax=Diatrype stigma TaxID=117547 RepID=A0AAN9YHY2_9PEZI
MDVDSHRSTGDSNKENVTGGLTAATESIGGNHHKKLKKATANTATATIAVTARNPFKDGPSPEKGSGQDRFREIIMADPRTGMPTAGIFANHAMPPQLRVTSTSMTPYSSGGSLTRAPSAMYPPSPDIGGLPSMPPQTRAQPAVPAGGRNVGSGQHGGSSTGTGQSSTAILSTECQKRSFNPAYKEWQTNNGRYKCSVNVNGVTVHDSRTFTTAQEAKRALALRAIAEVEKMPLPVRSITKNDQHHPGAGQPPLPPANATTGHPAASDHVYDHQTQHYTADSQDAQRLEANHLIGRIQALYEVPLNTPSSYIFTSTLASQAFLEGFAMGARLNDTAQHHYNVVEPVQVQQFRPRSPQAMIDRLYNGRFQRNVQDRDRSPVAPRGRAPHRERSPIRSSFAFGRDDVRRF